MKKISLLAIMLVLAMSFSAAQEFPQQNFCGKPHTLPCAQFVFGCSDSCLAGANTDPNLDPTGIAKESLRNPLARQLCYICNNWDYGMYTSFDEAKQKMAAEKVIPNPGGCTFNIGKPLDCPNYYMEWLGTEIGQWFDIQFISASIASLNSLLDLNGYQDAKACVDYVGTFNTIKGREGEFTQDMANPTMTFAEKYSKWLQFFRYGQSNNNINDKGTICGAVICSNPSDPSSCRDFDSVPKATCGSDGSCSQGEKVYVKRCALDNSPVPLCKILDRIAAMDDDMNYQVARQEWIVNDCHYGSYPGDGSLSNNFCQSCGLSININEFKEATFVNGETNLQTYDILPFITSNQQFPGLQIYNNIYPAQFAIASKDCSSAGACSSNDQNMHNSRFIRIGTPENCCGPSWGPGFGGTQNDLAYKAYFERYGGIVYQNGNWVVVDPNAPRHPGFVTGLGDSNIISYNTGDISVYGLVLPACMGETPVVSTQLSAATAVLPQNCITVPQDMCLLNGLNGPTLKMDNSQMLSVRSTLLPENQQPVFQVGNAQLLQIRNVRDVVNLVYPDSSPLKPEADAILNPIGGVEARDVPMTSDMCTAIGGGYVTAGKNVCQHQDGGFGVSCPYLYSKTKDGWDLEEDIFPGQTEDFMSDPYYTKMKNFDPENPELLIYEHLDETSYIDQVQLITVQHPEDTEVFSDVLGRFYTIKSPQKVVCIDDSGADCSAMLEKQDSAIESGSRLTEFGNLENIHMIDASSFGKEAWAQETNDETVGFMELTLPASGSNKAKLIVSFSKNPKKELSDEKPVIEKNFITGLLLKFGFFENQMKEEYKDKYQRNIIVQYLDGGEWKTYPMQDDYNLHTEVYKTYVIPLDMNIIRENKVRLVQRSAYAYDYVAVDYSEDKILSVDIQKPLEVSSLKNADSSELKLAKDDFIKIVFNKPALSGEKQSFFFMSKGYYEGDSQ